MGFQDQLSLNAGRKYCRMLQGEHSAILSTFVKKRFVIKTFVLSNFEWQGSKLALVRSYLQVHQAAGHVEILIFLVKIKFFPIYANIFCDAGQVPILRNYEGCVAVLHRFYCIALVSSKMLRCAGSYAQSHQSICFSHTQCMEVEEDCDQKPDLWHL